MSGINSSLISLNNYRKLQRYLILLASVSQKPIQRFLERKAGILWRCCPGCEHSGTPGRLFCCVCEILAASWTAVARGIAVTPCKAARRRSCLSVSVCSRLPTCPVSGTLSVTSLGDESGCRLRRRYRSPASLDMGWVCGLFLWLIRFSRWPA